MPGGKMEFGEQIDDAIKREILEETGLDIEVKEVLAVLNEIFFDVKKKEDYWQAIIFLFGVKIKNPVKIKKSAEGELKWFDLHSLPQEEVIPSDYQMIQQIVLQPETSISFYKLRILAEDDKFSLDYF